MSEEKTPPKLTAYRVYDYPTMPIVAARYEREWMNRTHERFAYRCLPLNIANQHGWFLLNTHKIRAVWNGKDDKGAVTVICKGGPKEAPCPAESHFGSGVLTFNLNYLFRTPPGWNLWARGPSNHPKDGVMALEGIIETDWSVATFTMNWKLTTVGVPVDFEIGEPICMITPVKRGEVEQFVPEVRKLSEEPGLMDAFNKWSESRNQFNDELAKGADWAIAKSWQKEYLQGFGPGVKAPEHQTKLSVREFADRTKSAGNTTP